jgi:hypothetical protein
MELKASAPVADGQVGDGFIRSPDGQIRQDGSFGIAGMGPVRGLRLAIETRTD